MSTGVSSFFTNKSYHPQLQIQNPINVPSIRSANSKSELSQLFFISIRQRELIRVPTLLVYLLIHTTTGLCTLFLHLHVTYDVTCDVMWL